MLRGQLVGAKQQPHFGWIVLKWKLVEAFPCPPCSRFSLEGGEGVSRLPAVLAPESLSTY